MSEQDRKDIATVISSILISNKKKMTMQQLNATFQQYEGQRIPHEKFGCSNLEQFLRTLSDKVQVNGSGMRAEVQVIVGSKVAHINDLIFQQKEPEKKRKRRSTKNRHFQPVGRRIFNSLPPKCPSTCTIKPLMSLTHQYTPITLTTTTVSTLPPMCPSTCTIKPLMSLIPQYTPFTLTTTTVSQLGAAAFRCTTPVILNTTQTASPATYDKSAVLKPAVNSNKNSAVLKPAVNSNKNSAEDIYYSNENLSNTRVPHIVQEKLRQIVAKYPQGILSTKLNKIYKEYYCKHLNYSEYGYRSMAQMCVDLRSIFHVVQISESDIKLFDKRNPIPQDINITKELQLMNINASTEKPTENALPQADIEDMAEICFEEMPPDVLEYGARLEQQWIDPGVNEHDYLDVTVGEVYDPSKFYIILKPYVIELNNLMDKMQMYYAIHRMELLVPYNALTEDLFVVCVFLKEYHRARIIDASRKNESLLKVYMVDYGTVGMVSVQGVCYLHNQFAKLPEQGIRARLAGICPATENEQWSMGATARFLSLVKQKDLKAQLIGIDEENRILDIILVDTMYDDHFIINNTLVALNYAILTFPVKDDADDSISELQNCTSSSTSQSNKKRQLTPKEVMRIIAEICK